MLVALPFFIISPIIYSVFLSTPRVSTGYPFQLFKNFIFHFPNLNLGLILTVVGRRKIKFK